MSIDYLSDDEYGCWLEGEEPPKEDRDKILEELRELNLKYTNLNKKVKKICDRKEASSFGFLLGGKKKYG